MKKSRAVNYDACIKNSQRAMMNGCRFSSIMTRWTMDFAKQQTSKWGDCNLTTRTIAFALVCILQRSLRIRWILHTIILLSQLSETHEVEVPASLHLKRNDYNVTILRATFNNNIIVVPFAHVQNNSTFAINILNEYGFVAFEFRWISDSHEGHD